MGLKQASIQRGRSEMLPLPRLTFDGLLSYVALAGGLALGFAIFKPPMDAIENAFKKRA